MMEYDREKAKFLEKEKKYEELFSYLLSFGENAEALKDLAVCYFHGWGTEKDYSKTFYYDAQAAQAGNVDALVALGYDYEHGIGVEKDLKKAFSLYLEAAEKGHRRAQRLTAMCYEYGDGTEKSVEKATEWYLKAIEQNDDISRVRLASIYYNTDDKNTDAKALECLFTAMNNLEKNDYYYYYCNYLLARYYETYRVEHNPENAFKCDLVAAEGGITDAMVHVAYCYKDGVGTKENNDEAIKWLCKAMEDMEDSFEKAQHLYVLANLYDADIEKIDIKKRDEYYSKAFEYFKKVTENDSDYIEAQFKIAQMYYEGQGVKASYKEAFAIYEKLSRNPEETIKVRAEFYLAKCYLLGNGVKKNLKKGFKLIKKAGKKGHCLSQIFTVYCYLLGIGTPQNSFLAKSYLASLEKFSKGNDAFYGQHVNLYKGIMYFHGLGVKKNNEKAKTYFEKSTALGKILYLPICCGDFKTADLLGKIFCKKYAFNFMILPDKKVAKDILMLAYNNDALSKKGLNLLFDVLTKKNIVTVKDKRLAFNVIKDFEDEEIILKKGQCLFYGFGTKKDYKKAFYCFEKSLAKVYIALCYINGLGVEKNWEKAREVLDGASDNLSLTLRGLLIYGGKFGYKKDKEKGLELLKNEENRIFYDVLSTVRGDLYVNLFIEIFIKILRRNIDNGLKMKLMVMVPFIKLLVLTIFKNPDSSNLSKKEMLRILLEQNQAMLERGNAHMEEQQAIYSALGYIRENTDKIPEVIEKQNQLLDVMRSVIDCVSEEKRALPNENSMRFLDEQQIEQIQARFIEETSLKIINSLKNEKVEKEEAFLEETFGEYWLKLDSYTRKSLLSARVLFNYCKNPAFENLDHSGVVVSATSALENELRLRLFVGYQEFMKKSGLEYNLWPEILVYRTKKGEIILNKNFTMGSVPYLFECSEKDKKHLLKYLESILPEKYIDKGILNFTTVSDTESFVDRCEKIRTSYRNAAAHTEPVNRQQAEACCNVIIGPDEAEEKLGQVQGVLYELVQLTEKL